MCPVCSAHEYMFKLYRIFHTGSCQRATTKEECESLARQQGLSDTIAKTNSYKRGPAYCYYKPGNRNKADRLFFNTAVAENTSPCTDTRKCVCKNGLLPGNII